jgi:hypothetical protein
MPAETSTADEYPPAPPGHGSDNRWLGFQPRTVIVVGILVFTVMVAEYVWLYAPFGSHTSSVATQDPSADSTGDSTVDSTTDTSSDAGPDATAYVALGTLTIRATPKTTASRLGSIPKGTSITITCVTTGEPVKGATKTDSHWDKVTFGSVTGYVSNTLVKTGAAIDDPKQIPAC